MIAASEDVSEVVPTRPAPGAGVDFITAVVVVTDDGVVIGDGVTDDDVAPLVASWLVVLGAIEGVLCADEPPYESECDDGDDEVAPACRPESSARATDASIVVATATPLKNRSVLRSISVVPFAAQGPLPMLGDNGAASMPLSVEVTAAWRELHGVTRASEP